MKIIFFSILIILFSCSSKRTGTYYWEYLKNAHYDQCQLRVYEWDHAGGANRVGDFPCDSINYIIKKYSKK
jgi:hypothetical protein